MANVKKADGDKRDGKYMIIPRSQTTYEEVFAVTNGKKFPFEIPVPLTHQDVLTLEGQKEPFQVDNVLTVPDAMEKFQCDQKKASEIVAAQSTHKEIGGKTIKWRAKYILQSV